MSGGQELDIKNRNTGLLKPLRIDDIDEVMDLANRSYPEKIRGRVTASLARQRQYMLTGLDNGTKQFKMEIDGKIAGACGLYKRGDSCPENVIWGDWFFVDPAKRNTTLTYRMGVELIRRAKESGYEHMYVETTADQPDYFNIAPYLLRFGFNQEGNLSNYLEKGVDLIFFGLNLKTWQNPSLKRY